MPEYLAPGVYVEEIEIGSKPIEGVGTSTAGFLGETERGPVTPTLVTGFTQFLRLFGDYSWPGQTRSAYLPYALEGFFANGGKRCFIGRIAADSKPATLPLGLESGKSIPISANGPGSWGGRVQVTVEKASVAMGDKVPASLAKLFKMTVEYWADALPPKEPPKPEQPKPGDGPPKPGDAPPKEAAKEQPAEPTIREEFDNLSADPSSSDFYVKRINSGSSLVTVSSDDPAASSGARPKDMARSPLKGGEDLKELKDTSFDGKADMGARTGLNGFAEIDEIAIVAAPNDGEIPGLTAKLVGHCENLKDRVAVLDVKLGTANFNALYPPQDSKYAAVYYPWIKIIDPDTSLEKLIPPSGHVTGIYARSDVERGVHKAPANEVVRGAVGLEFQLTKGDQDLLNPRGVNCIRSFVGRGIRVWGARTCSSDPLWKYVNVRRLMNFIEESIDEGTQWVVFEPNDQRLWARVKQTITDFLTRVWKDGALMGTTPEQAFWVKCDETTMTPNDIETGKLICLIGVAPVRPAEFVIFRIAQWRSGSAITE